MDEFDQLTSKYPEIASCAGDLRRAYDLLRATFVRGGKLLICGNGGSASDAEHLVGELMKGYLLPRPVGENVRKQLVAAFPQEANYLAAHLQGALPALSLVSQTSLLTAYANDVAPDMVFAQQVYGYGRSGDAVIGISTSGKSKNVVHAMQVGRALGLATISFTGRSGGDLNTICDVVVRVPHSATADIQERQLPIYHALCAKLEREFFG